MSTYKINKKILINSRDKIPDLCRLTASRRFPTLKEIEESLIEEALRRAEGNQTIAAELLGISRRALNNRLRRTGDNVKAKDSLFFILSFPVSP
ncbi:MAG: hypothetical protein A2057_12020 [Ignavibacteria bacterium GWA2_35_9]|nr:MAG: hypothetical protein A2057_12020 [Ignavibacteria bacterium GWA2_35_9]OGU43888.1 MAG: hypothetical protein A2000_01690 [Ignavibacteria bacterium GWB2_36_8]OGU48605.1 MAG: hypothetical protein A2080_12985 [Ignavibacteria bacterium GWC2_36_12]